MKYISKKTYRRNCWVSALVCMLPFATAVADNLKGTIEGVKTDTVLVFSYDLAKNTMLKIDTVALADHRFSLNVPSDKVVGVRIIPKPEHANDALKMFRGMPLFVLPGDCLTVSGNIDHLVPSGTALYDELSKLTNLDELEQQGQQLGMAYAQAARQGDEAKQDSLDEEMNKLVEVMTDEKMKYIKSAPHSLASAYLALNLPPREGAEACKLLGSDVREGALKPLLDISESSYANALKKEEAQKYIQPGMPAPDFTLKNLAGEQVSLSSFRGKYALLDFWGTWCGWCIKGMPKMKTYYEKYKDKIEFVGIDCRDTEDKWRAGVKKYGLPWVNLYNGFDNELMTKYAIPGFPTKILLDAEGKIVQVFVGESEEMYQKLDELLK